MSAAQALIRKLDLAPHPEGGWFRETWRSEVRIGDHAAGTAILFLLEQGQRSAWHRVDADEFWLWHAGAPLQLRLAGEDIASARELALGPNVLSGEQPQILIPAHHWQTAATTAGWALASCLVVPGFEFSGFTIASAELAAALDSLAPIANPGD